MNERSKILTFQRVCTLSFTVFLGLQLKTELEKICIGKKGKCCSRMKNYCKVFRQKDKYCSRIKKYCTVFKDIVIKTKYLFSVVLAQTFP